MSDFEKEQELEIEKAESKSLEEQETEQFIQVDDASKNRNKAQKKVKKDEQKLEQTVEDQKKQRRMLNRRKEQLALVDAIAELEKMKRHHFDKDSRDVESDETLFSSDSTDDENKDAEEMVSNGAEMDSKQNAAESDQEDKQADKKASSKKGIIVSGDVLSHVIHLLPLTERPFFPPQVAPLMLNEEPWLTTLDAIMKESPTKVVGLVMVKPDSPEKLEAKDFHEYGTLVRIHHPNRDDGRIQFIAQGMQRFRIKRWISKKIPFVVQVEYCDDNNFSNNEELRAYSMAVVNALKELMPLNPLYSEELKHFLSRFNTNDPSPLADFAASLTTSSKEDMQEILATVPILERMKKVVALIHKELEVARLQSNIRQQVDEKISDQQRKFFLREQLKVIQQELGLAKDDKTADIERFQQRLSKKTLSEAVSKKIEEEFEKLASLEIGSPEYAVTRNYLDIMTDLPWGIYSKDNLNLKQAKKVLDKAHFGLDDVKSRILELIAVGALKKEIRGSIVLLVGPPGVGKTSVGRSIADALNRKFYRFSLGGARDEAEIKGHRRTYIGAMPGKVIQALKETQVGNPVIMLDEIDKMGASYQGDPASALLEVLDPEQNIDFLDHYLDVRCDLSKVLFICTANTLDGIPEALLDRMEVIRLSGYITEEKQKIAQQYLWPRLLDRAGIQKKKLSILPSALIGVIDQYARESGVRQLEKYLNKLVRKVAVKLVEDDAQQIKITLADLENYLGQARFTKEKPIRGIGVATGLAWTAVGGVTLGLEVVKVHNKTRGFSLTGQLGDVMQESANIAYSYMYAHAANYGIKPEYFENAFLHLHAPEGATPKDGPSAGITIASAILSLALNKPTKAIAMTGELTLTGKVLAIGGVKEKLIAARRVGIKTVIFPKANEGEYKALPDYLKEGISVHFVSHYQEVAALLFEGMIKKPLK